MNIIFVCTSNTCRSPMAEGLAKKFIADYHKVPVSQLEEKGYHICSAGLTEDFEPAGSKASANAVLAMKNRNIDISKHRSQMLTKEIIQKADVCFCVTERHASHVLQIDASKASQVFTLGEDIDDPWHNSLHVYEDCAEKLQAVVYHQINKLCN